MSEPMAWAAGIIDGEGCIRIARRSGKNGHQLRVVVSNTDERIPRKLQEMFGGSVTMKVFRDRPNWRPQWDWVVSCRAAQRVVESVLPWLVSKKEQAELAIQSRQYAGSSPEITAIAEELSRLKRLTGAGQSASVVATRST